MAMAQRQAPAACLTYDEYLREGEVTYRYDIIDGVRVGPAAPLTVHQILLMNLTFVFEQYRRNGGVARPLPAPVDVLIRKAPLRVRQPDMIAISLAVYRAHNVRAIRGPLDFAPELVVEIISDSDQKKAFAGKIADYASIGVQECWVVRLVGEIVEVLVIIGRKLFPAATYVQGQDVQSVVFPDLRVPVADIFAD